MTDAREALKDNRKPDDACFLLCLPDELRDGTLQDDGGRVVDEDTTEVVIQVDDWDLAAKLYAHLGDHAFNDPTEIGINVFEIYPTVYLKEVCDRLDVSAEPTPAHPTETRVDFTAEEKQALIDLLREDQTSLSSMRHLRDEYETAKEAMVVFDKMPKITALAKLDPEGAAFVRKYVEETLLGPLFGQSRLFGSRTS